MTLMTESASIQSYAAIGVLIVLVAVVAIVILVVAHLSDLFPFVLRIFPFLPRMRHGATKDSPYESGVPLAAGSDRRLHIRFYIVALLFLLFDVEIIFLWPWALVYYHAAVDRLRIPLEGGGEAGAGFLLIGMGLFFALLLFGLVYEWKKGAFRWD